jgi:hypothetical protein
VAAGKWQVVTSEGLVNGETRVVTVAVVHWGGKAAKKIDV